jgi:3-hydroxyanthranilate 3,4-dioxygenase
MLLRIVENEKFRDVEIKEGEMFLLPGMSPRSAFVHISIPSF